MVRQARAMVRSGVIGGIRQVHLQYPTSLWSFTAA